MKLELKHLAPYLPYGLKCQFQQDLRQEFDNEDWVESLNIFNKGSIWTYSGYADEDLSIPLGEGDFSGFLIRNKNTYTSVGNSVKPILRPLSDLKKEINMDGDMVSAYEILPRREKEDYRNPIIGYWSWGAMEILFENHFDVFGLIEKGLAIDINTLEK